MNIVAWHDRDELNHLSMVNQYRSAGFDTLSLAVYDERTSPKFASIMIKRTAQTNQMQFIDLNPSWWKNRVASLAPLGFGPYKVSATGPPDDPLIATVFQPVTLSAPVTRVGITQKELIDTTIQLGFENFILKSVDAYGTGSDTRFIAVWYENSDHVAWNHFFSPDVTSFSNTDNAMQSVGISPVHISVTPSQGFLGIYADNWAKERAHSVAGLTSNQYQAKFDDFWKQGLMPIMVAAEGTGNATKFSAIFIHDEPVTSRQFRMIGNSSISVVDNAVERIMRANNIRGAALAVVRGTCLVYCRGYTWAEPHYPDIQPATFFRQASVSKLFAAVATYQLVSEKRLKLNDRMQDILHLATPEGNPPTDPEFGNITIRHLLEHSGGIPGILGNDVEIAAIFNKSLPVTPDDIASYCASRMLKDPFNPQSNAQYVPGTRKRYSNDGYFMLSRVIAKLRNVPSFMDAIQSMLQQLHITRVRISPSLIDTFPPNEARYHNHPCEYLLTGANVMSTDRPVVAQAYGDGNLGNYEGSGGLSASVVDVARLLAALNMFENNPILDEDTIQELFLNAAAVSGHGFDGVQVLDRAHNVYAGDKGGLLGKSQNSIYLTTEGGISYVVCWNGHTITSGNAWYPAFTAVFEAANQDLFRIGDFFPSFQMPSLDPLCNITRKRQIALPVPGLGINIFSEPYLSLEFPSKSGIQEDIHRKKQKTFNGSERESSNLRHSNIHKSL